MQTEIQTLPDRPVLYVRRYGAENNNFNRAAQEAYSVLCQYIVDHDLWGQLGDCLAITPDEPGGIIPDAECRFDVAFLLQEGATFQPAPSDEA